MKVKVHCAIINNAVQLLIMLIVNPEVDWIPGILNVFKVGVFVTASLWIILNWNLTCFKIWYTIQYIQEFPEHFHSFTDIIFQFKFQLWLSDLLNRAVDSDKKVLNHVYLTLASVCQIVGNYWPVK